MGSFRALPTSQESQLKRVSVRRAVRTFTPGRSHSGRSSRRAHALRMPLYGPRCLWAELLWHSCEVDGWACPNRGEHMSVRAMVIHPPAITKSVARTASPASPSASSLFYVPTRRSSSQSPSTAHAVFWANPRGNKQGTERPCGCHSFCACRRASRSSGDNPRECTAPKPNAGDPSTDAAEPPSSPRRSRNGAY